MAQFIIFWPLYVYKVWIVRGRLVDVWPIHRLPPVSSDLSRYSLNESHSFVPTYAPPSIHLKQRKTTTRTLNLQCNHHYHPWHCSFTIRNGVTPPLSVLLTPLNTNTPTPALTDLTITVTSTFITLVSLDNWANGYALLILLMLFSPVLKGDQSPLMIV